MRFSKLTIEWKLKDWIACGIGHMPYKILNPLSIEALRNGAAPKFRATYGDDFELLVSDWKAEDEYKRKILGGLI